MARFQSVGAVSNEDLNAIPVKQIGPAVAFYENFLGFTTLAQDESTARLSRDDVEIGLVRDPGHNPKTAGSMAFSIDDLDEMHEEMQERGGNPGDFRPGSWNGKHFRTFFMVEHENGYCYCFHHPA